MISKCSASVLIYLNYVFICSAFGDDCLVDAVTVQRDFDVSRYLGKWYEYRWHTREFFPPEERFKDYFHYYVQTADGNITNYVSGRDPTRVDGKCFFYHMYLVPTDTPGKFFWRKKNGEQYPYWVLETDYNRYAFVYGCYNISVSGTCIAARGWIWSRTPTIPRVISDRSPWFYNRTCLSSSTFLETLQTAECNVPAQYSVNTGQNCHVSDIPVQEDFDIQKYAGSWYEMRWLAQSYIPASELFQDYRHVFNPRGDGTLSAVITGRSKDGCFYRKAIIVPSATAGKLTLKVLDGSADQFPYWVIDTDYINYAVMYGCLNVTSDGKCVAARSTVWSRGTTLARRFQYRVNTVLQALCVNPVAFLDTSHHHACPECMDDSCFYKTNGESRHRHSSILLLLVILLAGAFFTNIP
ncbi:uncharacterized protein [Haliotis cracherodii]|uniref:uncharacterized protein n=1 Tax=Haliotis cracherodii TaxID=6455 RepID=UPI0039EB9C41